MMMIKSILASIFMLTALGTASAAICPPEKTLNGLVTLVETYNTSNKDKISLDIYKDDEAVSIVKALREEFGAPNLKFVDALVALTFPDKSVNVGAFDKDEQGTLCFIGKMTFTPEKWNIIIEKAVGFEVNNAQ